MFTHVYIPFLCARLDQIMVHVDTLDEIEIEDVGVGLPHALGVPL